MSKWSGYLKPGLVIILLGAGCGVEPLPPKPDDPPAAAFETELFTDDQDPALAGLSFVEDQLLAQVLPGAEPEALAAAYKQAGVTPVGELTGIDLRVLRVDKGTLESAGESLAATGMLESIQKNYIYEAARTPNDPLFTDKFDLAQIGAPKAWDITVGDADILIAIVDTGLQRDHPDLAGQIVSGRNVYDDNADFSDIAGHGTGVAGMAAALSDNGVGVTGVAWNSGLIGVRIADEDGRSTGRDLAAGILDAVAEGAKVINVSFAPLQSNSVVRSAARQAFNLGSLVIISSGNSGKTYSSRGYAEALFVGAVKSNNEIARFSDQGPYVDVVAPGVGVRTTALHDDYAWVSGTSFAAPIVSGVAALCWSVNPDLRPTSIIAAIEDTTRDLGVKGKDSTFGHGIVDAGAAVRAALATTIEADSTAPTVRVSSPAKNARKSRRFIAVATATGDDVADVVLSIDDAPFATDTRKPYRFSIDPKQFDSGSHQLKFVATDFNGNTSRAATVTVTFNTGGATSGGQIEFLSPASGSKVTTNVTIRADVTDSDGLTSVEWYVDGDLVAALPASGETSTVSFTWRASGETSGPHTITLVAIDSRGRSTRSNLDLVKK